MFKTNIIFFVCLFFVNSLVIAQDNNAIEKLREEIALCKEDTTKVKKLISLTLKLSRNDFKNALASAYDAFSLAKKLNYTLGEIRVYNSIADSYWYHADYEKAQEYYFKAYRISDSIHNERAIAHCLYNIGWIICIQQHNYAESSYLYKSWSIYERLKDTLGLLRIYGGLSSYYVDRFTAENSKQYFDSAVNYFNKGIEVAKKADLQVELGTIYGNMGELFYIQNDFKSANYYNQKGFEFKQKMQDSSSMMICLVNMGLCDLKTNQIVFNTFVPLTKEIQDKLKYRFGYFREGAENKYYKWINRGLIIGLIALFFAYSRGAWIALLAGSITIFIVKKKWMGKVIIVAVISLLVGIGWLATNNNYVRFAPDYQHTIFHNNLGEHLQSTTSLKDLSNAERFYRWVAGAKMFAAKPITGFGPNTFYNNYKNYTVDIFKTYVSNNPEHSSVHNYFLLMALEQGFIGLFLFVILLFCMLLYTQQLYHALQNNFYKAIALTTAIVIVMIATINCMSDMIETDKIGSLFWLSIGVIIVLKTKLEQEKNSIA